MKKIVLAAVIVCSSLALTAQTNKGDWMVGGDLLINTQSGNSQFSLDPNLGYFFLDNFVAGLKLNFGTEKKDDTKNTDIGAGVFARYYFNLKSGNFKPLLHTEYTLGNQSTTINSIKTKNTYGNFLLGAGGAFFINNNVALEAIAGYTRGKVQGKDVQNGFLFRIGFQVHLLGHEVAKVSGVGQ